METEILAPLRMPPWRLVFSRWIPLSLFYLVIGAPLIFPTLVALIIFPILPFWIQVLAEIEIRRANWLLPASVQDRPQWRQWEWRTVWRRVPTKQSWRQIATAFLQMIVGAITFVLVPTWIVTVLTTYYFFQGRGVIMADGSVISVMTTSGWQRIGLTAVFIAVPFLMLYLTVGLALVQVLLTRTFMRADDDALEKQVDLLADKQVTLVEAFEQERLRIERELHDGPQQHLASAAIHLGVIRAGASTDSEVDRGLGVVQNQLEAAAAELRHVLEGLRPRTLLEDGLAADISSLIADSSIPIRFDNQYSTRLGPAAELSLHFVVSEYLTNMYRHSGATEGSISLRTSPTAIAVDLTDNGRGGADLRGGTGIVGMSNRVKLMGGTFTVSSPIGGPTVLEVRLPPSTISEEQ